MRANIFDCLCFFSTSFAHYHPFLQLAPAVLMFLYSVQQDSQAQVVQYGSERARSYSDGVVLPADPGDGHLGVHALQEGREEMHWRRHGDNTTRRTQHQFASRHLHPHR